MMETQNEKKGAARSGGKIGQQHQERGFKTETRATDPAATGSTTEAKMEKKWNEEGNSSRENGESTNKFLTALGIVAGGALLYKAVKSLNGSGIKAVNRKAIVEIKSTMVIKRPKEELYSYWRDLENLPNFMSHIQEVVEVNNKRSHWVAQVPGGLGHIEWEAEIVWEQENQLLAWRSLPDSEIENSGEVRFQDSGNRKSTLVEATISYRPPLGKAGEMAAKLLNPAFRKVVENDLKDFKKLMESNRTSRQKGSHVSWM